MGSTPRPDPSDEARKLPRADRLLAVAERAGFVGRLGHEPVMAAVRLELEAARAAVLSGAPCPAPEAIEAALLGRLGGAAHGTLRRVVNATGVVIHTNLGRSPLSDATVGAMAAAGAGYSNLEFDLVAGARGDRYHHAEAALLRLTGAEAAVVVNNGAAAVLLSLAALCEARPSGAGGGDGVTEVIVSRSQLVEIGGGFRIPDVLRRSGAALVEVGTTNRTYLRDFEEAVSPRTRALLAVHRSNFRLDGFVTEPSLAELTALGRRLDLWVVEDLGSGALIPTAPFGLAPEPTVAERVATGADLVCFSGDKLLGGPQAGLIVGRAAAVARVRKHPLLRALRLDKVTLAGLAATLAHYERGEALREIPIWRAISRPLEAIREEADGWRVALADVAPGAVVRDSTSAVGGGTLPGETLPTAVLALPSSDPEALARRLRCGEPPVVARIERGAVLLDPRTVLPEEGALVVAALRGAMAGETGV
jgi:L-seryl-tRNA(Ser) seleniumtransferase